MKSRLKAPAEAGRKEQSNQHLEDWTIYDKMSKVAKRLKPKVEVLRELYLKSGNQCAFPGCYNALVDDSGNFIGQVCHIEAAEAGGERFNPHMTNEERRAFDNLMLMCYEHHIVTNDVVKYPVAMLKRMKKEHEDKFSSIIQKMSNSVMDYGIVNQYSESLTCRKLSDVLEYGCTEEENLENAKILNTLISKLMDVPIETRSLLAIMVTRSFNDMLGGCVVPLHEIEAATGKDSSFLIKHIDILNRRGVISEPDTDEYGRPFCNLYGDFESGWNYWGDIRDFCKKTGNSISKIFNDLDFSVFDE